MALTTIKNQPSGGLAKPVDFADNEKIRLGTGNDFDIYHTGSGAYIQNKTGNIFIGSNVDDDDGGDIRIQPKFGENSIVALDDGGVELYYDNSKKFQTNGSGVQVYENLYLDDNVNLKIGSGADLQLYHDGSHSYIKNVGTGHLYIVDTGIVKIQSDSFKVDNGDASKQVIKCNTDAGVELYYNGGKKFETTSLGTQVTGRINVSGNFEQDDNVKANWGNSHDLQIYHDGTYNWIDGVNNNPTILRAGTGDLYLQGNDIYIGNEGASETYIKAIGDGAVELYHDNSKKLETASGGINITNSGAIYLGGTGSSNALYDYEKGTFTPRFHGNGNNNTITTSTNLGEYVKIGRLVFVKMFVAFSNRNGANGVLAMDGLPFSNSGNHTGVPLGRWSNTQNAAVFGGFVGYISDGSQEIIFNEILTTGVGNSDINRTTDTTGCILAFSYPAWNQ